MKTDKYPKYLYVIYEGINPIYVGVTQMSVDYRFKCTYRSEYIMDNKDKLTYRVVSLIKNREELIKEEELILHFLSKGYKLENKIIGAGAGCATGGIDRKHNRYLPRKVNGESEAIRASKRRLAKKLIKRSSTIERPKKIQQIKDLLDLGHNLFQISHILNTDYGNLYRFVKKHIKDS